MSTNVTLCDLTVFQQMPDTPVVTPEPTPRGSPRPSPPSQRVATPPVTPDWTPDPSHADDVIPATPVLRVRRDSDDSETEAEVMQLGERIFFVSLTL